MTDQARQRVGTYELLELIGSGAQGSIFKARCLAEDNPNVRPGEVVALKRLGADSKEEEMYFLRQAEILQRLNHPSIVAYREIFVHNKGSFEEAKCMVMEFLDGESLSQTLEGYPEGLSWSKVQKIFLQILDGLAHAESQGVIHRDIKPSNIFMCRDGAVKIVDFGIARNVESGEATTGGWKGSLDYMAPDFVTTKNFSGDAVSDAYSVGVCFFRALTGQLPFSALSANASFEFFARWSTSKETSYPLGEVMLQKNFRKLKRCIQLLPGLHDFILKALSPVREGRFQGFSEMRDALAAIGYARVQGAIHTYELVDLLGQGGFGKVFLGRVVETGEYVAVKQLLSALNERRFAREADMLRKFGHPNIVRYIELIQANEGGPDLRSYLIMENLPGMPQWSLRNRLKVAQGSGLDTVNALEIFARYLLALNHLHANGIVHRDIKPANLYAPEDDVNNTKIFDFGIARESNSTLTQGSAPGTLDFMSPEFALQRDFKGSPSSDLYAIGLCLYEALTGRPAFERLSQSKMPVEAAFYMRAQSKPMPSFDLPLFQKNPRLQELLTRILHYNPRERYRTAYAVLQDIAAILSELTGKPSTLLDRVTPPENPPEPDRIAEYEQEPSLEELPGEELQTLATAFTSRTPDAAVKRNLSHHSGESGGDELDTSPTAKGQGGPSASKRRPAPVAVMEPTAKVEPAPAFPRKPAAPTLPPARSNRGLLILVALVVIGAGIGAFVYFGNNAAKPGRELEQRLAALTSAPAAPHSADVPAWAEAHAAAEAWLERKPDDDAVGIAADALQKQGRAWPKAVEAAFDSSLAAGKLDEARALTDAFAAIGGKENVISFVGLNTKSHERRLKNLRDQLDQAVAAANPVPVTPAPPPVTPPVKPDPVIAVTPPVMKPDPPLPAPDLKLEADLKTLRDATEPALADLLSAQSPDAVRTALDRIAGAWVPATGEVKTRALGLAWWHTRAEAIAGAIRRVTQPDGVDGRTARLATYRQLVDHELLHEWLPPDVHAAIRAEQEARESFCWVEIANDSGENVSVAGLAEATEIPAGERKAVRIPKGTTEVALRIAASGKTGLKPIELNLKPVAGAGLVASIPAFTPLPMPGGVRLAIRQPPTGPKVETTVRRPDGTAVSLEELGKLNDGEFLVQYLRPDHLPMQQKITLIPGKPLELAGPEFTAWKPVPALAALQAIPADLASVTAAQAEAWLKAVEGATLADPAHQALVSPSVSRLKEKLRAMTPVPAPAPAPGEVSPLDAWRDYFFQVGTFSGLSVGLRSEDRKVDSKPAAISAAAGSDPAAQRQELWRAIAGTKASRVEREAAAAKFDELSRSAAAAGNAEIALAAQVDAEILRSRRRKQPAKELVEKAPVLLKVRAHAMFAGPEGLSGGVSPQETLRDLLAYVRGGGTLNKYDTLLACYATYYAWRPSLTEPEENRRKFAKDPDYQRNIADMRRLNSDTAAQLAEILSRADTASAQGAAEVLFADTENGSWLLAAMTRILPNTHPLFAAGRKWLVDNPVNRVDINATLDHVGLESRIP